LCVFLSASCYRRTRVDPLEDRIEIAADSVIFAVIGDYGDSSRAEGQVANLVKSWDPDLIITLGDNNYDFGDSKTLVRNIGRFYGDYIYNPDAPEDQRVRGKAWREKLNRFFPSPGNHDYYNLRGLSPYLEYFTLPGNELYYDFIWGPVHFFSLNSGKLGKLNPDSEQLTWFKKRLVVSDSPWKIVYFHHPPYSISNHGNHPDWQLPYRQWGVSAVLSGHDHVYERIQEKQFPEFAWFVNGTGGRSTLYNCYPEKLDTSRFNVTCLNCCYGAMKVTATAGKIVFEYFSVNQSDSALDRWMLKK